MSVTPMRHLNIVAMKKDVKSLIKELTHSRCVELRKYQPSIEIETDRTSIENEYSEALALAEKIERVIKRLNPIAPAKALKEVGMFGKLPAMENELLDSSSGVFASEYLMVERVIEIDYRREEIENDLSQRKGDLIALEPWKDCVLPFDTQKTKETYFFFGTIPASFSVKDVDSILSENAMGAMIEVSSDNQNRYVIFICSKGAEADGFRILSSYSFSRLTMNSYDGLAKDNIARVEKTIQKLEDEKKALEDELVQIAMNITKIRLAYDYTATRCEQAKARLLMTDTKETVIIDGWYPKAVEEDLKKLIEQFDACYEFRDPVENEDVPIILNNPSPFNSFEGILGMYSMPKYGTFDPTVIMGIAFFVIFGFMLADVLYGLIITVACLLVASKANMGKSGKNLIRMFGICGISSIAAGVLFGSYFGDFPQIFCKTMLGIDAPNLVVWFDPMKDPMTFLVVSISIGVVHMMSGVIIKGVELIKHGKVFAGIFDQFTWVLLFAGVIVALLINQTVGIVMVGVAVLALILTQGRESKNPILKLFNGIKSLYGIVGYASDLLSYSRIMALGLSSAVVASVMNTLSTLVGPSVLGYVVMAIILIVGHVINIAINLLGTFVHASRLQYIEFFGKFFEDGGVEFKPLEAKLKYSKYAE